MAWCSVKNTGTLPLPFLLRDTNLAHTKEENGDLLATSLIGRENIAQDVVRLQTKGVIEMQNDRK
jgi:hypothetical protein